MPRANSFPFWKAFMIKGSKQKVTKDVCEMCVKMAGKCGGVPFTLISGNP